MSINNDKLLNRNVCLNNIFKRILVIIIITTALILIIFFIFILITFLIVKGICQFLAPVGPLGLRTTPNPLEPLGIRGFHPLNSASESYKHLRSLRPLFQFCIVDRRLWKPTTAYKGPLLSCIQPSISKQFTPLIQSYTEALPLYLRPSFASYSAGSAVVGLEQYRSTSSEQQACTTGLWNPTVQQNTTLFFRISRCNHYITLHNSYILPFLTHLKITKHLNCYKRLSDSVSS